MFVNAFFMLEKKADGGVRGIDWNKSKKIGENIHFNNIDPKVDPKLKTYESILIYVNN